MYVLNDFCKKEINIISFLYVTLAFAKRAVI